MAKEGNGEGQVMLGPLTVFFPDASFTTFWFMQDLVDLLGVGYNSEAKAALKTALKGRRGIQIEYEADNVTVHARGVEAMLDALTALDSLAVTRPLWTSEALSQAHAAMKAWRRPRPVRYDVGDIVAVPLDTIEGLGGFGVAQVAIFTSALWTPAEKAGASKRERGCPLLYLFDLWAPSANEVRRELEAGVGKAMGRMAILDTEIVSGHWPIVGARSVSEPEARAALVSVNGSSSSSGAVTYPLAYYAGRVAWDAGQGYAERLLRPGVSPPAKPRLLRHLFEARLTAAFGCIPEPVREGLAVLHVHVAYPGQDPSPDFTNAVRLAEILEKTVPGAERITRTMVLGRPWRFQS